MLTSSSLKTSFASNTTFTILILILYFLSSSFEYAFPSDCLLVAVFPFFFSNLCLVVGNEAACFLFRLVAYFTDNKKLTFNWFWRHRTGRANFKKKCLPQEIVETWNTPNSVRLEFRGGESKEKGQASNVETVLHLIRIIIQGKVMESTDENNTANQSTDITSELHDGTTTPIWT